MGSTKTDAEIVKLRNLMRGQGTHREARHSIARALVRSDFNLSDEINSFLLQSTYKISQDQWVNFPFESHDWDDAKKIAACRKLSILSNLATLVEQHIVENKSSIIRLIDFSDSISCSLLQTPELDPTPLFNDLQAFDRQSLFFWRVLAAANHQNGKLLAIRISTEMRSKWATQKFLYPFVFAAVNQPPESHIPSSLKYVLSGIEMEWERRFIEYAAGYQGGVLGNEAGFMWLALLTHPFDALDLLCDILEECNASGNAPPQEVVSCANKIASALNYRRLDSLLRRCRNEPIEVLEHMEASHIQLPLSVQAKEFYQSLICANSLEFGRTGSDLFNSLIEIRTDRYPTQANYDYVVFSSRSWRFTEAGRLLDSLAYLFYLLPRSEWKSEAKQFFRLADFYGGANALILTAPGLATSKRRDEIFSKRWLDISVDLEVRAKAIGEAQDRTWINLLHREVSEDQIQGRVGSWISKIEKHCPIKRNYLSGADWSWIEEVIKQRKIAPFRGDLRAAYVFLLKGIEQSDPDFSVIRSILRPVYTPLSLSEFTELLIKSYGTRAAAFCYFFLSPENLLLMDMSTNEVDAMAGRIAALEECIRQNGFCEIVTVDVYLDEVRALDAAISYSNISSSQFDVPWQSFSNDMMIRTKDLYDSFCDLSQKNEGGGFPMGASETESTVTFPNGVSMRVTLPNFQWASAEIAVEVVNSFIRDPGYGLEAILGTRIRHNVIEREFDGALKALSRSSIPGVFKGVAIRISDEIIGAIKDGIQSWVDVYMQSRRPSKPNGIFRLTPDQKELSSLIAGIENSSDQRDAVRGIIAWLQARLRDDLNAAQNSLDVDLREALGKCIQEQRRMLVDRDAERLQDIDSVTSALQSEVDRKISQVIHWFDWPHEMNSDTITLLEICSAAVARFAGEIEIKNLQVCLSDELYQVVYPRSAARPMLDISSEVFVNVFKHGKAGPSSIRISIKCIEGESFIAFSSCRDDDGQVEVRCIQGERHNSQIEYLYASAGSGLKRIAGCYATAVRKQENVSIVARKGYFHVLLPIGDEV